MELYEAINRRYSVRAYMDKLVESDKLDRILEAGRLAPSSNNRQAWKFVVARNAKLRGALAEACEQPFLAKAPVIVAVVGLEPERKMSCDILADVVDCSIAATHMMLAAAVDLLTRAGASARVDRDEAAVPVLSISGRGGVPRAAEFAAHGDHRFAAALVADLHVAPGNALRPAGADRFENRLFRRPAAPYANRSPSWPKA